MPVSTYAANKFFDHIYRNQAYTPAATLYIGLYTTMPAADDTGGVEVSGNAYARVALSFGAASSRTLTTNAAAAFAQASGGNWGTIVGYGIFDALTSGNLMGSEKFGAVTTAEVITLASGLGQTANSNIFGVTVKNSGDSTTYVEGTDYYIQYDLGIIGRIATGAITASQVLHVTYSSPVTQVINNGNNFQVNSGDISLGFKAFK